MFRNDSQPVKKLATLLYFKVLVGYFLEKECQSLSPYRMATVKSPVQKDDNVIALQHTGVGVSFKG